MLESLPSTLGVYPIISLDLRILKIEVGKGESPCRVFFNSVRVAFRRVKVTESSVCMVCHLFVSYFIPKKRFEYPFTET